MNTRGSGERTSVAISNYQVWPTVTPGAGSWAKICTPLATTRSHRRPTSPTNTVPLNKEA